jgi:hypothetical protein
MFANEVLLIALVLGSLWIAAGWLGYGMCNLAKYDQWTVPKNAIESELRWKFLVGGGPATVLFVSILLIIQAMDEMSGSR